MSTQTENTESTPRLSQGDAEQMREVVLAALEDAKSEDVKVLDVRKLTDITDYMIVATGTSDRHIKTQTTRVLEQMRESGWKHRGVEGEESKDWVLVDFVDVVIHIMRGSTRKRYDLEGLWDKTFGDLAPEGSANEVIQAEVAQ